MKEKKLSNVSRSGKKFCSGTGIQLQGLALETLKKFGINLETIKTEVNFLNFEMVDYEEKKSSVFGEKESICYSMVFVIYNIEFQAKLLTFEYKAKSEILKLHIACKTVSVKKELRYCCNSLQRRRNLNLMFITLISFARYLESRRLICDVLLRKVDCIRIEENKDGGKIVVYSDERRNIRLGVFWSVECNSEHEVIDKVEIYYKVTELPKRGDIKHKLTHLTEPNLDFNVKYHLWKELLQCLTGDTSVDNDVEARLTRRINCNSTHPSGRSNSIIQNNADKIWVLSYPQLLPNKNIVKKEEVDDNDDITVVPVTASKCLPSEANPLICIKNPNLLSKNSKEASIILSDNEQPEDKSNLSISNRQTDVSDHIIHIDSLDNSRNPELSSSKCGEIVSCSTISSSLGKGIEVVDISSPVRRKRDSENSQDCLILPLNCIDNEKLSDSNKLPTVCKDLTKTISVDTVDSDTESVILISSDVQKGNQISPVLSENKKLLLKYSNLDRSKAITSKSVENQIIPDSSVGTMSTIADADLSVPQKKPKLIDDDLEIIGVVYVVPD